VFAITLAQDVLGLLPQGLHTHEKFVTPVELRNTLLDQRFRVGPTFGWILLHFYSV
jgi:2-polyprenyl-3-methyl-5-hydroxy-6-metoxy-1,4-benzoquinol methylase